VDMQGQLGNRLFEFSNIIANSIEYHYSVINLDFNEYEKYFESTLNSEFGDLNIKTKISKKYSLINSVFKKLIRSLYSVLLKIKYLKSQVHELIIVENYIAGESYKLNDPNFIKSAQSKIVFLSGTWYTDSPGFVKHTQSIKKIFEALTIYTDLISKKKAGLKRNENLLIGVHIRKGDYLHFMGGAPYFENEVYLERMRQTDRLLKLTGKKLVFILCSNETIDVSYFSDSM
jgi:hypothetical protein